MCDVFFRDCLFLQKNITSETLISFGKILSDQSSSEDTGKKSFSTS